jgi:transposase
MNQLHVVPLNEGLRRKKALWRPAGRKELESIVLAPWASRRRQDLLELLDQLTPKIQELTRALEEEVEKRPVTRLLMTHPGVGPLTALAYELVIGTPERFHCGKQLASYIGLVPEEKSSGDRRRLGHISKHGNVLLRFLAGGSGTGRRAQSPGVAQQVLSSRDAAWTQDRESSDGAQAGGASVLDVASGSGLRPDAEARFARGRAPEIPMVSSKSPM